MYNTCCISGFLSADDSIDCCGMNEEIVSNCSATLAIKFVGSTISGKLKR